MTIVFNGRMNIPNYVGLSTDLVDDKIPSNCSGGNQPGLIIFLSDTSETKIINADLTLSDYVIPTSGAVGGNMACIDVTPTLTVHSSYVAGDYVGTSGTAMVFSGASRINNFTGTILSATLIDYDLQSVACELWLFDTAITPPADSAAWSIADTDAARCIGIIPFSTYYASALNSVSFVSSVGLGFKTLTGSTSIYGCLVTRGAPTYADGHLIIRLNIIQD